LAPQKRKEKTNSRSSKDEKKKRSKNNATLRKVGTIEHGLLCSKC